MKVREMWSPFQDKKMVINIARKINQIATNLKKQGYERINIMHVCGTHEHTITYYGLRTLLPLNVNVIAGPGCPVCVVPANEIDEAIKLAEEGIKVFTYGDMYRVPGSQKSLAIAKADGADVSVVYGFPDAVQLAKKLDKDAVFFGVGFETTAPTAASFIVRNKIPQNLSILTSYRITVPAVEYVLKSNHELNGIICPGHVSTIVGARAWSFISEKYHLPTVIAGFEPVDVMLALYEILRQLEEGDVRTVNEYRRVVKWEGNIVAKKYLENAFMVIDAHWRGIGVISKSGWALHERFNNLDAREKYGIRIEHGIDIKGDCKCADIILGKSIPTDCPYFGNSCKPQHPIGPCMVSSEGTCSIWFKYGGHLSRKLKRADKEINS